MDKGSRTERYTEEEIDYLEAHIAKHFGDFPTVFHEIASPDIHVDIAIVEPTPERNYYTLVTMGMGAHRMKLPEALAQDKLKRAEILVCLPPDWEVKGKDEEWYWPIRWLKILARLPIDQDTWLGWGHTVPAGEPFASDTQLCGVMLLTPGNYPPEVSECLLPGGDVINFYQMIPLYKEELDYKVNNGAEALLERMDDKLLSVVDKNRKNSCAVRPTKNFAKRSDEIREILQWDGPAGCFATDRIMVDGCKVAYMYREEPDPNVPDSGWRFMAGDESDEYMDNAQNSGIYHLNTICNYDGDIVQYLQEPYGTAYFRGEDGIFREELYISWDE